MITALLLRHYKNYDNLNFVPISDNAEYRYSAYVGNNGVGKSAVLEAIDVSLNGKDWNITYGQKKTEAFICLTFLIDKKKSIDSKYKKGIEAISEFFWNVDENANSNIKSTPELMKWLEHRNKLKEKYGKSHYLILIGEKFDDTKLAYFTTFDGALKSVLKTVLTLKPSDLSELLNEIKEYVYGLYNYIYIPVESSPKELLQLQNNTMQQLLNRDLLNEIEKILKSTRGGQKAIVTQINENLDEFMTEVNTVISEVDKNYEFKNEQRARKNLTAKDIREKILEAYFPLRTLKMSGIPISQLSSGEQRKAIIDVAYSILVTNGEKETEKEIVLAIDEPEASMHISNCFIQFQLLEELAAKYKRQILLTTHWYGFLPIAQNGNLHHITPGNKGKRIDSFCLYNLLESKRSFPDVIELKSMYDLATSIITYMRIKPEISWIICEGSDDKLYLENVLKGIKNINILPVGGCGNVIKLYRIIFSSLTENAEEKNSKAIFIIDTDLQQKPIGTKMELSGSSAKVLLRRLQIENGEIKLINPEICNTYSQTEIEDCLNPEMYYKAILACAEKLDDSNMVSLIKDYNVKKNAKASIIRGDDSCLEPVNIEAANNKKQLINFVENDENKKLIATEYSKLISASESNVKHILKDEIVALIK